MSLEELYIEILEESRRVSKDDVNYTPEGKGGYRCKNCHHYEGGVKCGILRQPINPEGLCSEFSPVHSKHLDRVTAPETPSGNPTTKSSPAINTMMRSDPSISQGPV